MKVWIVLGVSLLSYLLLAGLLAYLQADFVNLDFIAYGTIARRIVDSPLLSVSSYWSPLFSWMMTPLLVAGQDDLFAGRLILLVSGAVYLCAVYGLALSVCGTDSVTDRVICIGTMTCSIIQAAISANELLVPDLLASALLFLYFCLCTNGELRRNSRLWELLTGAVAGASYLASASLLPFCMLHFVLTLFIESRWREYSDKPRSMTWRDARAIGLFVTGLLVVAGPWVYRLSQVKGQFTICTAWAANHANVGIDCSSENPLWKPGLVRDYIFEPDFAPDWSAFQDTSHFLYQLKLILRNSSQCVMTVSPWLLIYFWSLSMIGYRQIHLSAKENAFLIWSTITVLVYSASFMTVRFEFHQVVAVIVPLLCLSSLIMFRAVLLPIRDDATVRVPRSESELDQTAVQVFWKKAFVQIQLFAEAWPTILVIASVLLLSTLDIYRLVQMVKVHPGSTRREVFHHIAQRLTSLRIPEDRIACNHWQFGLYVAYAANCLENYLGSPLIETSDDMVYELELNNVSAFLRLIPDPQIIKNTKVSNPFDGRRVWTRIATIRHPGLKPQALEVYVQD